MVVTIPAALLKSTSAGQVVSIGTGVTLISPGDAVVSPSTRIKVDGVSTILLGPSSSPPPPISYPLLASTLLLKPMQWKRGGRSNQITGIRWKLIWADARTQESLLGDEDFVDQFKDALNYLPRSM